jgi:transposase-like protein
MAKAENGSEIIKADSKGRMRVSPQRREELLSEFEKSGLSGAEFARLAGVKYQTFANWRQARRRRALCAPAARAVQGSPVKWLEAVVDQAQAAPPASTSGLVVRLPSGVFLEVANAAQARTAAVLLRAWEKEPC